MKKEFIGSRISKMYDIEMGRGRGSHNAKKKKNGKGEINERLRGAGGGY